MILFKMIIFKYTKFKSFECNLFLKLVLIDFGKRNTISVQIQRRLVERNNNSVLDSKRLGQRNKISAQIQRSFTPSTT